VSETDLRGAARLGTVLDDEYQLTRFISEGGMGSVYEAVQLRFNRRVAVKIMAPELAENEEALGRFRREVAVTSQLSHPHVVQLLDYGTAPGGQPYLVMEYLDGEDLDRRLARVGRLPLPQALEIVKQTASALAAIHAKGIVHRDLKPANVFLLPIEGAPDFVKLVDFGISKVRTARTKLTRAFTMVGTPEFMAPEQAMASESVDHRADQWALACVTWQMLSARLPFWGETLNELLQRVIHEPPPSLLALAPELPREVEAVLRRALSKRQDERYPTVLAFARALEQAAAPPRVADARGGPPRTTARQGRGWLIGAGAALLLAIGAAVAYRELRAPEATSATDPPPAARGEPAPDRPARTKRASSPGNPHR
jgi:serine/threonine-protein kinase